MNRNVLEKLGWFLIYSGLGLVALGLYLRRSNEWLGWAMAAAGAADTLGGALLLWLRRRKGEEP